MEDLPPVDMLVSLLLVSCGVHYCGALFGISGVFRVILEGASSYYHNQFH